MERALLVTIRLDDDKEGWGLEDSALELEELVASCGAQVVENITCLRQRPTPNLYIGKGKAAEISLLCQDLAADTVIFSRDLSGTQQRNLEEVIGRKTIDRTQLILDIFARHAKTPEGHMQVELAQLEYLMPRLVGKGISLSRLGGGIGTRGPGEQKLEVDRRRIRARIERLRVALKQVRLQRTSLRKRRQENAVPSVALVGYTNAGKSTLLNTLTQAGQSVAEGLFTTLDPLSKNLRLPNGENIVISDTVGFLHQLPHHLIEAFKATLEEVVQADMLVHVLDISHRLYRQYHQAVLEVLEKLGALEKPVITVLNKIDLVSDVSVWQQAEQDFPHAVAISAKENQNIAGLLQKIEENFASRLVRLELRLRHSRMDLVDLFYRQGKVEEIKYQQKGIRVKVLLPRALSYNFLKDKEIEIIRENI